CLLRLSTSLLVLSSCHHARPPHPLTLSLHDALPIWLRLLLQPISHRRRRAGALAHRPARHVRADALGNRARARSRQAALDRFFRSEEHTSELQSRENLVCRLLLEKKK